MEAEMDKTPFGQKLIAWVNSLPEEIHPNEELVEDFEALLGQPMPVAPAKAAEIKPDVETLAEPAPPKPPEEDDRNDTLEARLRFQRAAQNNPIGPEHRWTKAEPTKKPGWGGGDGREPLE